MKTRTIIRTAIVLTFSTLSFVSCDNEPDIPEWPNKSTAEAPDRTVLIYMVGENSLSRYCARNIDSIMSGLQNVADPINILVYEDSNSNKGVLWKIGRNNGGVTKEVVKSYGNQNSVNVSRMATVIKEAFHMYPGEEKGLVLWSHGSGWLPTGDYTPAQAPASDRPVFYSFGQDNTDEMEIWELRMALEQAPKMDFLIFDACHMASVEVAYELKDVTDYLLASTTEIMGTGFPYQTITPILNQEELDLVAIGKAYTSYYNGITNYGGTLSLIKTEGLDRLASQYARVYDQYSSRLSSIKGNDLQQFGRQISASADFTNIFYDMKDVVDNLAQGEDAEFKSALEEVIVYEGHSADFLSIKLNRNSGMSVFMPELNTDEVYNDAYKELKWWTATRY